MDNIKIRKSYRKEGFRAPVFDYRPDWPYISIGYGTEKEYFIENLSLLIASGMGIVSALTSISEHVRGRKMKKVTQYILQSVIEGIPLWKALQETKFMPQRVIALVRSGEEAGRLPEHLSLATVQQRKEKIFKSRIRSSLIYPGIVLILAFIVGLIGAWIVLPELVSVFGDSKTNLPFNTQLLILLANFFKEYGAIAVPSIIFFVGICVYLLFVNRKTKFVGDWFLFRTPNIKTLITGIELSRFGYITGALLQAGFQPSEALESIKEGSNYDAYADFYDFIKENILQGNSFKTSLESYKKSTMFIPSPIQQLIISAEKSGRLAETFIKIGVIFEEKTEAMSEDLSTVLEPFVLIIVGLIVGFVVSGILGPIYGLSSQL